MLRHSTTPAVHAGLPPLSGREPRAGSRPAWDHSANTRRVRFDRTARRTVGSPAQVLDVDRPEGFHPAGNSQLRGVPVSCSPRCISSKAGRTIERLFAQTQRDVTAIKRRFVPTESGRRRRPELRSGRRSFPTLNMPYAEVRRPDPANHPCRIEWFALVPVPRLCSSTACPGSRRPPCHRPPQRPVLAPGHTLLVGRTSPDPRLLARQSPRPPFLGPRRGSPRNPSSPLTAEARPYYRARGPRRPGSPAAGPIRQPFRRPADCQNLVWATVSSEPLPSHAARVAVRRSRRSIPSRRRSDPCRSCSSCRHPRV